jgi:hypothetical protein
MIGYLERIRSFENCHWSMVIGHWGKEVIFITAFVIDVERLDDEL